MNFNFLRIPIANSIKTATVIQGTNIGGSKGN